MITINLDLETTFLDVVDPTKVRIIEIGVVIWDWKTHTPLLMGSQLVWDKNDPSYVWDDRIFQLTGISQEALELIGDSLWTAFEKFYMNYIEPFEKAGIPLTVAIAHNGNIFDKKVWEAELQRVREGFPSNEVIEALSGWHWVDSMSDVPYEKNITTRKLTYLAAEKGFINPFPHRALPDVLTMTRIIGGYDIESIVERSKAPKIIAVADVKKPWQDSKPAGEKGVDVAKEFGYKWNGDKKVWCKEILETELEDERARAANHFRVGVIRPKPIEQKEELTNETNF